MKGIIFQFHTTFACTFGQIVMGLLNVWPSYTTAIYTSNATTPLSEPMTTSEESLLGSLPSLGAMAGTAMVGVAVDKLGRRNGGIVLLLPAVISWAMISATTSKLVVLVARFLGGVTGGGTLVFAPLFISEVADASVRGMLASAPIFMYCAGTLLSYVIGWFLTYRVIVWLNIAASVISVLLIMSVTESPVYLIRQRRDEDARASLAHYRGCAPSSAAVLDEFSKLKAQLMPVTELISVTAEKDTKAELKAEDEEKEKLNGESVEPDEHKTMSPLKRIIVSPSSRRGFLVVLTVISMQVFMGIVPVQVYAKTVFTQTDPSKSDLYTVIFAVVLLSGALVTSSVADKAGRRILIITSSVLVCVFMMSLGWLLQRGGAPWLTVLAIMLYCFCFMFGAGTVPYVLLAEVFVSEVQSLASMIIVEWVWFLNFLIIAIFPFMNSFLGIHGTFYLFGVVALANAFISYFIVPETKGLTNEEIQEVLLGKKTKQIK